MTSAFVEVKQELQHCGDAQHLTPVLEQHKERLAYVYAVFCKTKEITLTHFQPLSVCCPLQLCHLAAMSLQTSAFNFLTVGRGALKLSGVYMYNAGAALHRKPQPPILADTYVFLRSHLARCSFVSKRPRLLNMFAMMD